MYPTNVRIKTTKTTKKTTFLLYFMNNRMLITVYDSSGQTIKATNQVKWQKG